MTLIKSLLLGSAAGIVAVASAQAADLPTRKGAPAAQYVKICTITAGGTPITGFVLPGSDTCLKISGYITAQAEGGNLKTAYSYGYDGGVQSVNTNRFNRSDLGYTVRGNLTLDAVSNTAYGPLLGHLEYQFNHGSGFDNTGAGGSDGGLNRAYVTWAGITAGKANSFYSFQGGGPGWANFLSPDRWGFNQPDLFAYTASFGGGFSATLSVESTLPGSIGGNSAGPINQDGGSVQSNLPGFSQGGMRSPDIVGNLKAVQSWGSAGISGVAHQVRTVADVADLAGGNVSTLDKWGWGVTGGVSFNLPSFGAGDDVSISAAYSRNAIQYGGMAPGEMMWGEGGAVNGNGQQLALADTFYDGGGRWATPTSWSVTGFMDHHFSPQFSISPEGSYGEVNWTGDPAGVLTDGKTYIVGAVAHYDPVVNLDFELELLYQNSHSDRPAALAAGLPWHANADGFAARFEVTRSW